MALIVLGLVSLVVASCATTIAVAAVLRRNSEQRALNRLEANMRVAWYVVHRSGGDVHLTQDGQIAVGDVRLNGNLRLVDEMQRLVGGVATVFQLDQRVATNVLMADGTRGLGTRLAAGPARDALLGGHRSFRGLATVLGQTYYAAYDPIFARDGRFVGILFVGLRQADFLAGLAAGKNVLLGVSVGTLALVGLAFAALTWRVLRREAALAQAGLHRDAALDNMSSGLLFYDATGRLALSNNRFHELCSMDRQSIRAGMSRREVLERMVEAGHFVGSRAEELDDTIRRDLASGRPHVVEAEFGGSRRVEIERRPITGGGTVTTYEDVTERRQATEQLFHMARHDGLTGLPNRVVLAERLEGAMAALGRGVGSAVLCLDLDRFKSVNDTLGHAAGDALLNQVAKRLVSCVRETDTVARLGGDEFAVLQVGVAKAEDAALLAERILQVTRESYEVGGHSVMVGVSIGIALAPTDGTGAAQIMRNADTALGRAKLDGRDGFCFFEAAMDLRLQERRALEMDLRQALAAEEFELYFQPLVDLRRNRVSGFEALLRWHHATRGLVSPTEFIPVVEETSLIVPLGAWVLHAACAEAVRWPDDLKVAVNLSPVQFRDATLVQEVEDALSRSGLAPGRLELEITETVLLRDNEEVVRVLQELRALGVSISMDDFGTGYSSLSYLRSFPFDKIKIDRSFVADLPGSDAGCIVRAVANLGSSLGMITTAEGVESAAQLAQLRVEGCTEAQGFFFSPPRPRSEVMTMLSRAHGLLKGGKELAADLA